MTDPVSLAADVLKGHRASIDRLDAIREVLVRSGHILDPRQIGSRGDGPAHLEGSEDTALHEIGPGHSADCGHHLTGRPVYLPLGSMANRHGGLIGNRIDDETINVVSLRAENGLPDAKITR